MRSLTAASHRLRVLAFSILCTIGLTACNSQQAAAPTTPPKVGQVIARVGNEDVTIHELQNEYRNAGISSDRITEPLTRAALQEITRRKLLAQKAITAGLDREPTVLLDLLRMREQVLAAALVQRDTQARVAGLGRTEIERFMNANADRFGRRVRFDVDQITVGSAAIRPEFLDEIKDATSLDVIEAKIKDLRIPYNRGAGAVFTGEIPAELVEKLRNRKGTDVFFVRSGQTGSFFKVRDEAADPLAGEDARVRAQGMMRTEAAQAEIVKKAEETQITYFGEYVKLMAGPEAPVGGAAPAATTPAGGTPAAPRP